MDLVESGGGRLTEVTPEKVVRFPIISPEMNEFWGLFNLVSEGYSLATYISVEVGPLGPLLSMLCFWADCF